MLFGVDPASPKMADGVFSTLARFAAQCKGALQDLDAMEKRRKREERRLAKKKAVSAGQEHAAADPLTPKSKGGMMDKVLALTRDKKQFRGEMRDGGKGVQLLLMDDAGPSP